MQLYISVAIRAFRRATTYRSAYVSGIITNAFFGALLCFIYQALYANGGVVAGLSLNDAISYTWATQSLISVGGAWINNTEIATAIRSGDIITDLMRPWSFYIYWMSRTLGERCFNLFFRGSFTYLIGVLYFGARIPDLGEFLAFIPVITLAMFISFAFGFIVNITTFWLLDNTGIIMLAAVVQSFFSGFLLPLAFFPPFLQAIAYALPFHTITSLPAQIFLGQLATTELTSVLLLQIFWGAVLCGIGLLMQQAVMRKVIIQGG